MTTERDDLIDDLVDRMTALVRRVDWRGAEVELRNILAEAATALGPLPEGCDLSDPIRKLRKRARHHAEVSRLDTAHAQEAGDLNEAQELIESAAFHHRKSVSYQAAVDILAREARCEQIR